MHLQLEPADGPKAFADESFCEAASAGFYVLAAAVFEPGRHDEVRAVLRDLRGHRRGGKLHWNDMDAQQRHNAAKKLGELDGFHVVAVGSPVPQRRQERAGAMCLKALVFELAGFGVREIVMEGRTAQLNLRDVRTVAGARYELGMPFRIWHVSGAVEPLLWATGC